MVSTLQQAPPVDTRTQPRCVHMQETHTLEKKNWATRLMAVVVVVTMVTSTLVLVAPQASARTGSDDYGYTFKDSAESDGPTYSWIEIIPALGGSALGDYTELTMDNSNRQAMWAMLT